VFLAEICAPAMTAPDESVMVPESVAPVTCERAGIEKIQQNPNTNIADKTLAIFLSAHFIHSIGCLPQLFD
jgi:hypothetical protein